MIHEREDYNERVKCVDGSIPEEESVFLLRGKDFHAAQVILFWAFLNRNQLPEDKIQSVIEHAGRMRSYYHDIHPSDGCTS